MSLVFDKKLVELPGFETKCYVNDPEVPKVLKGQARAAHYVRGVVIHTVTGQPRQPAVLAGAHPSTRAEHFARYQARTKREVSWHYTVDTDGTIVQSADPARWMCWHAGGVNSWTVGVELCQGPEGALYEPQMGALVALVTHLCDGFGLPRRYPVRAATGLPHGGVIPAIAKPKAIWPGCFGHRNQTPDRGHGDPGDAPFLALARAGYVGVPFA